MIIIAINKAHQSKVNKAVKWLTKYNEQNSLRDLAMDNGDESKFKKLDRVCGMAFDRYLDLVTELPKRERLRIEKSELY